HSVFKSEYIRMAQYRARKQAGGLIGQPLAYARGSVPVSQKQVRRTNCGLRKTISKCSSQKTRCRFLGWSGSGRHGVKTGKHRIARSRTFSASTRPNFY